MATNPKRIDQNEPLELIKFQVTAALRLAVDRQVVEERTTLRDFCTRAITAALQRRKAA